MSARLLKVLVVMLAVTGLTLAFGLRAESRPAEHIDGEPKTLDVWIDGDDEIAPNEECIWEAMVEGGTSPFSYQWWGALSGTGKTIEGSLSQSSWMKVEVTDHLGAKDTANIDIFVDESYACDF